MPYLIIVPPHIQNQIRKMHPLLKSRIRASLDSIAINPNQAKLLKDELEGLYSYRMSRYRIIYSIVEKTFKNFIIFSF